MATFLDSEKHAQTAIDEFKRKLHDSRRQSAIDNRWFILASRIANWLRSPPDGHATAEGTPNARRILEELYGPKHGRPDEIDRLLKHMGQDNKECWLRVLTILLQMEHDGQNMGKHIYEFFKQKILDTSIGKLTESYLEPKFRHMKIDPNERSRLAREFSRLQWELCTRDTFDQVHGCVYEYGREWIIPVTEKNPLKEGGTGTLYIVEVPSECIPSALAEQIGGRQYTRINENGTGGEVRQFALKVLTRQESYEDEQTAYDNLLQEDGIIRYLGGWVLDNLPKDRIERKEYYLLLEFGAYDLSEFFSLYPTPSTTEEIIQFWDALSHLPTALGKIHRCVLPTTKVRSLGWHCDIKPANIIYCNSGKRKGWKIGDPGFATFVEEQHVKKHDGLPVIQFKGGTNAYGGPEGIGYGQPLVSQRFDIWSLGCVFSEAATWVAFGHRGITLFQLVRKSGKLGHVTHAEQSNNLESGGSFGAVHDDELTRIRGKDQFHDGSKMSSAVEKWHLHVRQALRRCDLLTEKILGIVESDMLRANPNERRSANEVAEKFMSCIAIARRDADKHIVYKLPSYFKHAINQEQEQESQAIQERMTKEGSEKWRDKYKSRAFIDATKEPLNIQLDDHEELSQTDVSPVSRSPTMVHTIPRSSTWDAGYKPDSRTSVSETALSRAKTDKSKRPLGTLHYMEARRLLEDAGWTSGTLEIPQTAGNTEGHIDSPKNPLPIRSSDTSPLLRSPKAPVQLSRTRSNRFASMSLVRKWIGASSKSKSTNSSGPSGLSPTVDDATFVRTEPVTMQKADAMTRDRENSEHSIHRYESFDSYFKGRDIALLIDNAPSMTEHWIYARDLVSVLVAFLHGQDDDGIDLYFTASSQPVGTFHEPKQFVEEMNKHRPYDGSQPKFSDTQSLLGNTPSEFVPPQSIPRAGTASTASSSELGETRNINEVLDGILRPWSTGFHEGDKKKLTLIVLTDGIWAGVRNKRIVASCIKNAVETALNRGPLRKQLGQRGLSIQFVRFGNDPQAMEILDYMDNHLAGDDGKPLPDIIDHEPANGDVVKMILGSLDPRYDEDTQIVTGSTDDDYQTVTEMDERHEQGELSREPYTTGSISHSTPKRISQTGRSVAGSGAGDHRPRLGQAHTMQVGHSSRSYQDH